MARPRLVPWEIMLAVKRKCGDRGAVGGQVGGAVALMDIEVDDQHMGGLVLPDPASRDDREIVEHAVTGTASVERVVATAGHIGGKTMLHGQFRCEPGAARRQRG